MTVTAVTTPLPEAKAEIKALAKSLTPKQRPGDFAQAMMDLGSAICTPRTPLCLLCPLSATCRAFAEGDPEQFPTKLAKAARPQRYGTIFWAERDDKVLLVRRPPKGLLGGMRALPTGPWAEAPPGLADPPVSASWQMLGATVDHVFTHFRLELALAVAPVEGHSDAYESWHESGGEWWPIADIQSAGLPTVFAKAARAFRRAG